MATARAVNAGAPSAWPHALGSAECAAALRRALAEEDGAAAALVP
jgi:hypothetical protein